MYEAPHIAQAFSCPIRDLQGVPSVLDYRCPRIWFKKNKNVDLMEYSRGSFQQVLPLPEDAE